MTVADYAWNPWGVMGVLAALMTAAMAFVVYFTRPDRTQNRRLAVLLAVEASIACTGTGLMFLATAREDAYAWQAPAVMGLQAIGFLYLRFIATLDTPLARWLRHPVSDGVLLTGAIVAPLTWFWHPEWFVAGMVDVWFVPWELLPGPGWLIMFELLVVVYVFGFVCAVHAWLRTSKDSALRRRNRLFAIAFGWRDLAFSFFLIGPIVLPGLSYDTTYGGLFWASAPSTTLVVFVPLLAYGILKGQLFDIDLKIKIATRRSLLVALFATGFLVVSEGAESLVGLEGILPQIMGAGAVAIALRPIQRLAHAFADRALPVPTDAAYIGRRKREVYRVAIEGALEDGAVSIRERTVLERVGRELGLLAHEMAAIEADVIGATRTTQRLDA